MNVEAHDGDLNVREILFATDFSDASANAARLAVQTARRLGARLHVLHVVPPVTDPVPSQRALADLGKALERDVQLITELRSGSPAHEIVAYASRNAIDMIVIGAHGCTGLSRVLLGSVAEAVMRRAPCPVLVVPVVRSRNRHTPCAPDVDVDPQPQRCVVCTNPATELICEPCRARIRGEALERKLEDERAGRR